MRCSRGSLALISERAATLLLDHTHSLNPRHSLATHRAAARPAIPTQFPGERQRRAADKFRWQFPDGESDADSDVRAARAIHQVSRKPVNGH